MKQHNHSDESLDNGWYISDSPVAADEQKAHNTPVLLPTYPARTSVDNLRFRGEFEIRGQLSTDFVVERSSNHRHDICLYTEKDEDSHPISVYGRRAKASRRGIYVCIEPAYATSRESVCSVSFSAPQVLYGSNEHILSAEECERAIEIVESTLIDLGVQMNVREAKLTRVDVLRHLDMNRPVTCHVNVLHFLTVKYSRYSLNFPTGLRRGNKSTQLCIYDKGFQMKEKKLAPDRVTPLSPQHKQLLAKLQDETILRVEWRLRRAEPIREELGVVSISDLLAKFHSLDRWLTRKLKANLFREKLPYDVEDFIGKPPLDNPTLQQRTAFLAQMLGGTSVAVQQALFFESFERWMHLRGRRYLPDLRKMHSGDRGKDEFIKFQTKVRLTMMHGLSKDGIRNAVLYEELRRAVEAPLNGAWSQLPPRYRTARRRQAPAPKTSLRRR